MDGVGSPQVTMSKTELESRVETCQFLSREVRCWHVGFMFNSSLFSSEIHVNLCGLGLAMTTRIHVVAQALKSELKT